MPYRKEQFVNDGIYHVILRGLDDNLIFKHVNDYYRGIFSIYEFNNSDSVNIRDRREQRKAEKKREPRDPEPRDPFSGSFPENGSRGGYIDKREKFVDVLCFCFMPNHIHLLLKQIKDDGITRFMRKVGAGYGRYFNKKYERKGYVFQNRFRAVYIEDDNQFRIIFNYIHSNPISLFEPGWKESGIKNPKEVAKFLEEYKWSSYKDYIGENNFPSVTERNFMSDFMGGLKGCKISIKDWIEFKKVLNRSEAVLLE